MAKAEIIVTQAWQQIATGIAATTVLERSTKGGTLYINEVAADLAAYQDSPDRGDQFLQNESVPTFIRADQDGWKVIIDGVL